MSSELIVDFDDGLEVALEGGALFARGALQPVAFLHASPERDELVHVWDVVLDAAIGGIGLEFLGREEPVGDDALAQTLCETGRSGDSQ